MKLLILNGPNLNLLGKREPRHYGTQRFEKFFDYLVKKYPNIQFDYFQSNYEGAIIDKIQNAPMQGFNGIILNAGAYTHYSYAIHDAIRAVEIPVVEVHISNIFAREEFRQKSVLAPACAGTITGFGLSSYELAVNFFIIKNNL